MNGFDMVCNLCGDKGMAKRGVAILAPMRYSLKIINKDDEGRRITGWRTICL